MVYVLLANGFEEVEALTPVDYLRRCDGVNVVMVGIGGSSVTGSHGITVQCDCSDDQCQLEDMDMVVLPGGMPGTKHLDQSPFVERALKTAVKQGAVIGAICAAPSVLGHKGLLQGKKATCYPGFEGELTGAQVMSDPVCVDGRIVTGKGAGAANLFAFALIEQLCGRERAAAIEAAVQWEK